MNAKCLILIMLSVSAVVPAPAQSSNVVVTGTVDRIDATAISVKNNASDALENFKLAPKVLVVQNKPATLADIKPDDFVASAAVRDADGRLHSTELRIFPDTLRHASTKPT